jgi:hypothetical protein
MMTAHQQARRDRAVGRGAGMKSQAAEYLRRADRISERFAGGQPILVGHHSERGARRDHDRMTALMRKGVTLLRASEHAASSYAGHAILSDDPDAIAALTAKAEKLETLQTIYKAVNKLVRKNDVAGIVALGVAMGHPLGESTATQLCTGGKYERGIQPYELTSINNKIKTARARILELQRAAVAAAMEPISGEIDGFAFTISEDIADNRIVIAFDRKPSREILKTLQQAAFKWSPTRGTHIRQRNNAAIYAAKYALGVV